jgi:hypothetical protein
MNTKRKIMLQLIILSLSSAAPVVSLHAQAPSPVPFISTPLVPSAAPPLSPEFTLIVNGAGFVSNSVVTWNGIKLSTRFINSGQLAATVPDGYVASAGTASVSVVTPGSGASNVAYFEITNPAKSVAFGSPTGAGGAGNWIVVADFNGDGKPDLAGTHSGFTTTDGIFLPYPTVTVELGNGDGTFQPAVKYTVHENPFSIIAGDFNGDGKLDLAVATERGGEVDVMLGNGDGTFQFAPSYVFGFGPELKGMAVGDLNGDGTLDLVVARGALVSLLLGNGDGTFRSGGDLPVGTFDSPFASVAVGDFNGDGYLDLVFTDFKQVYVLLSNGNGTFQPPVPYPGDHAASVAVADFNGDGKPDLAVASGGIVSILLGNGDGTFQPSMNYGGDGFWIAARDFNGDGIPDLAVASAVNVSVLIGSGDGTFQPARTFAGGSSIDSIAGADFNGDGSMDLALGHDEGGSLLCSNRPRPAVLHNSLAATPSMAARRSTAPSPQPRLWATAPA